jgi:hypothetical protein
MPGRPACERPGRSGRSSSFTPQASLHAQSGQPGCTSPDSKPKTKSCALFAPEPHHGQLSCVVAVAVSTYNCRAMSALEPFGRPLRRCSRARSRWSSMEGSVSLEPDQAGTKIRCSAESSERSSLATTPEPRRDRLGSLPTPRPRFPPPSILTVGHLLAPGQTHSRNLSLSLIRGREIKGVRVAWPMRRTASPGYRTVTCPAARPQVWAVVREANRRVMLLREHSWRSTPARHVAANGSR